MNERGESQDIITVTSDGQRYRNGIEETIDDAIAFPAVVDVSVEQVRPTIAELIGSATTAAAMIAKSGGARAGKADQERRLAFCSSCSHLSSRSQCVHIRLADGTVEHGCGCYMPIKVNFAAMECPLGKWGKVSTGKAKCGGCGKR